MLCSIMLSADEDQYQMMITKCIYILEFTFTKCMRWSLSTRICFWLLFLHAFGLFRFLFCVVQYCLRVIIHKVKKVICTTRTGTSFTNANTNRWPLHDSRYWDNTKSPDRCIFIMGSATPGKAVFILKESPNTHNRCLFEQIYHINHMKGISRNALYRRKLSHCPNRLRNYQEKIPVSYLQRCCGFLFCVSELKIKLSEPFCFLAQKISQHVSKVCWIFHIFHKGWALCHMYITVSYLIKLTRLQWPVYLNKLTQKCKVKKGK